MKHLLTFILIISIPLGGCFSRKNEQQIKGETKNAVYAQEDGDVEYAEWYDKIQQEELESYLLENNDLIKSDIMSFYEFYRKYGEETVECYYFYSEYSDRQNSYEHLIQLGIVKLNDNEYNILIETYLLPFGQHIDLATSAKLYNYRFNFKTQDGWDNVIVGDFYFDNENAVLNMECEKSFNPTGKNFAGRIYGGGPHVLKKGNYYQDIGIIE
ncbi:MAG: hypothetical protein LBQ89_08895 [Treponema sp.]|jgi:hypothetical protein|nr:hypothetical protein [Treponema sp.]